MNNLAVYYERKEYLPKLFMQKYLVGAQIGQGSFGIVKEAVHIETGKRYALKIVRLSQIRKNLNGLSNFAAELNVYKKIIGLSIAHTCRILGVYRNSEKQKIYILLDFCDFSLSELIFSTTKRQDPDENSDIIEHGGFDETFCCLVIRQLLEGLRELHEKYFILHNDIKEHNIMMRGSDLQIIDFGVAQDLEEIVNMIRRDLLKEDLDKFLKTVGSPMYQSPELVTTKTDRKEQLLADFRENPFIIFKIDIWAAGIMLYYLLMGRYPFRGDTIYLLLVNIDQGDIKWPDKNVSEDCLDFLKKMLANDWKQRSCARELLNHRWLKRNAEEELEVFSTLVSQGKSTLFRQSLFPSRENELKDFIQTTLNSKKYINTSAEIQEMLDLSAAFLDTPRHEGSFVRMSVNPEFSLSSPSSKVAGYCCFQ